MLIIFMKILFFSRYFMKNEILTEFKKYGAIPTNILIPDHFVDLKKWAVVACDQYTSQKDYWKDVEDFCKGSPSTDNLIFPECYLEDDDKEERYTVPLKEKVKPRSKSTDEIKESNELISNKCLIF